MAILTYRRVTGLACLTLLVFASAQQATGQLGRIGGVKDRLKKKAPSLSSLLEGKPPITTSLDDAEYGVDSMENHTLPAVAAQLTDLERTLKGGFILRQGYYVITSQSYCLKAGTHGPGGGDGYLYAPTKGPAEEAVMTIVRNSVHRTEIPQNQIQQLLWAIIARAKFEDLNAELKAVASRLLAPQQLAMLNRSGLDAVPDSVMQKLVSEAPAGVRQTLAAEGKLRQMLTDPGSTFAQMEQVAVLTGAAPLGEGSRAVPTGRWSIHPDGYYVRYLPSGYSTTRVEIWVPQGSPAVGKEFDPATHIAVPGNTARQRLIQSGRSHDK
jgi:hypothetical protein